MLNVGNVKHILVSVRLSPHLARGRWILFVSKPSTDHGVSDTVAPEFLLPAGLEVDDGQTSLVQGFCQRYVLFPT